MNVDILDKFEKVDLGFKLSHAEFRCKCKAEDCTFTMVNHRIPAAFGIVRKHWGAPIGVSSGFRCQRHNKESGGVRDSWHKKGSAIDIFPMDGNLIGLYNLAKKFFDLIIIYEEEGFLHCQMED